MWYLSLSLSVMYVIYMYICMGFWVGLWVQVDAFTDSAFKGNPAAVCLLEEERDEKWLQAVAAEFNFSETCYLTRLSGSDSLDSSNPRFRLRWFTPVAEVSLLNFTSTLKKTIILKMFQKCYLLNFNICLCGCYLFILYIYIYIYI